MTTQYRPTPRPTLCPCGDVATERTYKNGTRHRECHRLTCRRPSMLPFPGLAALAIALRPIGRAPHPPRPLTPKMRAALALLAIEGLIYSGAHFYLTLDRFETIAPATLGTLRRYGMVRRWCPYGPDFPRWVLA